MAIKGPTLVFTSKQETESCMREVIPALTKIPHVLVNDVDRFFSYFSTSGPGNDPSGWPELILLHLDCLEEERLESLLLSIKDSAPRVKPLVVGFGGNIRDDVVQKAYDNGMNAYFPLQDLPALSVTMEDLTSVPARG